MKIPPLSVRDAPVHRQIEIQDARGKSGEHPDNSRRLPEVRPSSEFKKSRISADRYPAFQA
jgi:hypothetical protein